MARVLALLVGLLGMWAFAKAADAGPWPQILGPTRNGKAADEKLADRWPEDGPKTLWSRPVGEGFAGVAVDEGRVVLFHRLQDEEVVEAIDAATGKTLWKAGFPTNYVSTIAPDNGPRCVPLISDKFVYVRGVQGQMACLALADGKVRWSRNPNQDYEAPEGYFGAGSTPIIVQDKLLVNVGAQGAGLVALSPETGKTLWKATDEQSSYAAPTAATVGDTRHVIFVTRYSALSVDPQNGKLRFHFPFGKRGPTVNGATPLVIGEHLFLSASYGIGAVAAKIGAGEPKILWQSDEVMSSQYTTCVEHQGMLYGIDGRQDQGVARMRAIDPVTGKVLWTKPGFGMATLIAADGKLIAVTTDGQLVLIRLDPSKYRELARAQVFPTTTRALPALSDGRLYARDRNTLKCIELGQTSAE